MEPFSDSFLYYNIVLFLISLFFCALFSFLETSITALRLFKLKELEKITGKYKGLFDALENNPHRVLITILIANNLANVTAATISSQIMESLSNMLNVSEGIGFSIGIGLTTFAILIFGEVVPKNLAKFQGERIFKSLLWFTNLVFRIFGPVVNILVKISDFFINKFRGAKHAESTEYVTSEKEIQFLIDYINEKGLMDRQKTLMLKSIFKLSTTHAREIMVPETAIISINSELTLEEALNVFCTYKFSRLPVYEKDSDNIIGMLHQKDLFLRLSKHENKAIKDIVRPIIFVPESMKVFQLLKELKDQRMHIAMVVNEHGSITGLVTLEDVLEEIVGEITDEYEAVPEKIITLKPGAWLVDGGIELDELTGLLNIEFETGHALTLGGFLTEYLQRVPKKGEQVIYKKYHFQVQNADHKRVFQVLLFQDDLKDTISSS